MMISNSPVIIAFRPTRNRLLLSLLALIIVSLFMLVVAGANTVSADGETYTYSNSSTIQAEGGHFYEPAVFRQEAAPGATFVGRITISFNTPGFWGMGSSNIICRLDAVITVAQQTPTSGTISAIEFIGTEISAPGSSTAPGCSPNHNEVHDFINSHLSTTVSITGSSNLGTEAQGARVLTGKTFAENYKSPPSTDTITLRSRPSNNIVGSVSVEKMPASSDTPIINNEYQFYTFADVDPGEYRVCSAAANTCVDVEKLFGFSLRVEDLGSRRTFDSAGIVRVEVQIVGMVNVAEGATFGPLNLILMNDADEVIASGSTNESSPHVRTANSGFAPEDTQKLLVGIIDNIIPGTYRACLQDKPDVCSEYKTKTENAVLTLSLEARGDPSGGLTAASPTGTEDDPYIVCVHNTPFFGWLFCSLINMLDWAVGTFYRAVQDDLQVFSTGDASSSATTQILDGDGGINRVNDVWQGFRNIARVALALVLMFIIYAQIASSSITEAYNVKRMLPRLAMAIIAIELSWVIFPWFAILIEDFGRGMGSFLHGMSVGGATDAIQVQLNLSGVTQGFLFLGLVAAIAGAVVAPMAFAGALLGVIPLAVGALLAVLTVFFILAVRRVLLVALLVVAPIALLLWILPNTEGVFKKWFSTYRNLLLMYPMIVTLIVLGQILAPIVIVQDNGFTQYVAIIVLFAPYFMVPFTFKWAAGAAGAIAGVASNLSKALKAQTGKPVEWGKNRIKEGEKFGKMNRLTNLPEGLEPGASGRQRAAHAWRRMKAGRAPWQSREGSLGELKETATRQEADKTFDAISDARVMSQEKEWKASGMGQNTINDNLRAMSLNQEVGVAMQRAAARALTASPGGIGAIHEMLKELDSGDAQQKILAQQMRKDNFAAWKDKAPHLMRHSTDPLYETYQGFNVGDMHSIKGGEHERVMRLMAKDASVAAATGDTTKAQANSGAFRDAMTAFHGATKTSEGVSKMETGLVQTYHKLLNSHDPDIQAAISSVDPDVVADLRARISADGRIAEATQPVNIV